MTKTEIIPAILPVDFDELTDKIGLVKDAVKTIQIDVCDGQFTPQPTWPYRKHDDSFAKIVSQEEGLPGWEKVNFEIDLMANKPEEKVEDWVNAGVTRIILHIESKGDVGKAIEMLKGRVEVGLAVGEETPIEMIQDSRFMIQEGAIQSIQLMGIDHIGFQGQKFDPKVIEKVKEVKKLYPGIPVSIDGGVSLETAKLLIEAGADRLVVGSAIFGSDNFLEAIANFKRL